MRPRRASEAILLMADRRAQVEETTKQGGILFWHFCRLFCKISHQKPPKMEWRSFAQCAIPKTEPARQRIARLPLPAEPPGDFRAEDPGCPLPIVDEFL